MPVHAGNPGSTAAEPESTDRNSLGRPGVAPIKTSHQCFSTLAAKHKDVQ